MSPINRLSSAAQPGRHDEEQAGADREREPAALADLGQVGAEEQQVDDQEEARESLTVVLTNAGASVRAASSAKEVLQWLPQLAPGEFPEVLVCDIAMPGEDGYAVLRRLRAWKARDGSMPLQILQEKVDRWLAAASAH